MTLLVQNLPYISASESSAGRYPYFKEKTLSFEQTDPLAEISNKIAFELWWDYTKALFKVEYEDSDLTSRIFCKILGVLEKAEISSEKTFVEATLDNSVLIIGKSANANFHFEVYFDSVEYAIGYEAICNYYKNKELVVSVSGSIDYVVRKISSHFD